MSEKITLTDNQKLILDRFRKRIKRERFVNNQSNLYYKKLNSKFIVPGIVITGLCSVASFLSTTESISEDVKVGFSVGVGVLTAIATVIQSVSTSFGFQTRSDAFQKSAETYDRLLTKIEFQIYNPSDDFNEFCNKLEDDIIAIKNDCKYIPPYSMYKLYKDLKQEKEEEKSKLFLQSIGYTDNNNVVITIGDGDGDGEGGVDVEGGEDGQDDEGGEDGQDDEGDQDGEVGDENV